jgi:hypothetical protein
MTKYEFFVTDIGPAEAPSKEAVEPPCHCPYLAALGHVIECEWKIWKDKLVRTILAFCLLCSPALAQTYNHPGCPNGDGSILAILKSTHPYESSGIVETEEGGLMTSVQAAECENIYPKMSYVFDVAFNFCAAACPDVACGAPHGAVANWATLGFGHGIVLDVKMETPYISHYYGCDPQPGSNGKTTVWSGCPEGSTTVAVQWADFDDPSKKGWTYYTLPKTQSKLIREIEWANPGPATVTRVNPNRKFRITINSQADATSFFKRFGISNTVERAVIVRIIAYNFITYTSYQTPTGLIDVQAATEIFSDATYYHSVKPIGPPAEWLNN